MKVVGSLFFLLQKSGFLVAVRCVFLILQFNFMKPSRFWAIPSAIFPGFSVPCCDLACVVLLAAEGAPGAGGVRAGAVPARRAQRGPA